MYTLHARHGVGVGRLPTLAMYTVCKWSCVFFLFLRSLLPSPRSVLLHKYICTSLRELLSLSHLNRSTWHRLRLHSVAFKASGAPDSVSPLFFSRVCFRIVNCSSHVGSRGSSGEKKVSSAREATRAARRDSVKSNNRAYREIVLRSVCACKIKIKRKREKKKKRKKSVHSPLEQHARERRRIWERSTKGRLKESSLSVEGVERRLSRLHLWNVTSTTV